MHLPFDPAGGMAVLGMPACGDGAPFESGPPPTATGTLHHPPNLPTSAVIDGMADHRDMTLAFADRDFVAVAGFRPTAGTMAAGSLARLRAGGRSRAVHDLQHPRRGGGERGPCGEGAAAARKLVPATE